MVKKAGRKREEYALHSLMMGGASMRAARGDVSERVIQREGRWRSDAYTLRRTPGIMRTMHDRCLVN